MDLYQLRRLPDVTGKNNHRRNGQFRVAAFFLKEAGGLHKISRAGQSESLTAAAMKKWGTGMWTFFRITWNIFCLTVLSFRSTEGSFVVTAWPYR
ncbi:hypothetical protein SAMN04488522_10571 [Pedobacter caeni]|uniref:Uncharacterized protein n=1 Tax=Pedobacter caeni TaxID=288992 RepID=A0A1M5IUX5_9SPHI|nr:hypothetical protein SAMN04488522_10571 [Pedobacter caeni]